MPQVVEVKVRHAYRLTGSPKGRRDHIRRDRFAVGRVLKKDGPARERSAGFQNFQDELAYVCITIKAGSVVLSVDKKELASRLDGTYKGKVLMERGFVQRPNFF